MSIASQIKYAFCDLCARRVRLNGVGTDSTKLNSFLRKVFQFTFFYTAREFRPAADIHDVLVNQGPQMESFAQFVERVDFVFRTKCVEIANQKSGFLRLYLLGKADELHACLTFNAGKGYPQISCKLRGHCDDRNIDIVGLLNEHKARKKSA